MEIKEIQIGDYIKACSPKVQQEECICLVTEYVLDQMITEKNLFEDIILTPLDLSEDLLFANGFVKIGTSFIKTGEFDFILRESQDSYWFDFGGRQIVVEHVHHLQHLLRDCGMREFADNFVIL